MQSLIELLISAYEGVPLKFSFMWHVIKCTQAENFTQPIYFESGYASKTLSLDGPDQQLTANIFRAERMCSVNACSVFAAGCSLLQGWLFCKWSLTSG